MNVVFGSSVDDDNDEDDSSVSATQPPEECHKLAALTDAYRTLGVCLVTFRNEWSDDLRLPHEAPILNNFDSRNIEIGIGHLAHVSDASLSHKALRVAVHGHGDVEVEAPTSLREVDQDYRRE